MFHDHQPIIATSARNSADGFKRVCQFVLATIQVRLPTACSGVRTLYKTGERAPGTFFGSKLGGLDYLDERAEELWSQCEHLAATLAGRELENALIDVLIDIPGIGLAKAGFIAQIVYGVSGCIDTHNLVRFGIPARRFTPSLAQLTTKRRAKLITEYNETVEHCGGTEQLWDDWCAYVSQVQGYGTADEVSAMHLVATDYQQLAA
jgi:hypothetical protein